MTDKATCQHLEVIRHGVLPSGVLDRWTCKDCGAEFFPLDLTPGKIQVMEPHASLRDQFAMAALTGWLAAGEAGIWNHTDDVLREVAQEPYRMADAMMKAREAK